MTSKIRIVIADDHGVVRKGLMTLLEEEETIDIVGEAGNGLEALDLIERERPEVALLDITMPVMNGIEATEQITKKYKYTRVLIFSMHNNEDYIMKAIECGAYGYLLKDTTKEEIMKAIKTVAGGEKYFANSVSNIIVQSYLEKSKGPTGPARQEDDSKLSRKEKEVLGLIVDGMSSREIAEKLDLSVRTVDNHRANMMKKLNVKNAVELVKAALREKLF